MKILIGSSSPPDRGAGVNAYVNSLSESLVSLGHEVHYLSPAPSSTTWLDDHGIHHFGSGQDDVPEESCLNILKYLDRHKIAAAINNDHPFLQSIAPVLNIPILSIGHMSQTSVARLACYQNEWIDYVVAISGHMQQVYCKKYGVPLNKVPIVYSGAKDSGVDLDALSEASDHEPLKLIFGGGMNPNKGAYLLLTSLLKNSQQWKNIQLDWFGDVPDKHKAKLSHLAFVNFHGRRAKNEFHQILKQADILLLPSYAEGCPMIMLEAMSYGVIPIASNGIGAMSHLIISGQEGFICALDSWSEQMLSCLTYLDRDRGVLTGMKVAVYKRFKAEFTATKTTETLLALLKRPTVDRKNRQQYFNVLRWHRPLIKGTSKAPFLDRLCIKLGYLRKSKTVYL
jgi:glycosyltransferase involved in cell wall biosynthesis